MTVPPENYELYDDERGELRCPFCDGRMLRVDNYAECTDCGESFQKRGGNDSSRNASLSDFEVRADHESR